MDKLLAIVSLLVLGAFLGILVAWVPSVDLTVVVVIVLAMAAYDFYRSLFGSRNGGR